MILKMPLYCDGFRCTADKCKDNCCIGWEIDIDDDTKNIYLNKEGEFGERLRKNISENSFILDMHERCPFLNKDNLCDVIINMGENNLCQICNDHPRYFEWFDNLKEGGIGLGCEEAARIILECKENDKFIEYEIPYESADMYDDLLYKTLYTAREKIFERINDDSTPIYNRIIDVLFFVGKLQHMTDNGVYRVPDIETCQVTNKCELDKILADILSLEPINEKWDKYIKRMASMYDDIFEIKENIRSTYTQISGYLKNISVYFIWRYFMKGVFSEEYLSYVKIMAIYVAVTEYLIFCSIKEKGKFDFEECVDIVKDFSKQVEYSEENMDFLADIVYEKEYYDTTRLSGLFA